MIEHTYVTYVAYFEWKDMFFIRHRIQIKMTTRNFKTRNDCITMLIEIVNYSFLISFINVVEKCITEI